MIDDVRYELAAAKNPGFAAAAVTTLALGSAPQRPCSASFKAFCFLHLPSLDPDRLVSFRPPASMAALHPRKHHRPMDGLAKASRTLEPPALYRWDVQLSCPAGWSESLGGMVVTPGIFRNCSDGRRARPRIHGGGSEPGRKFRPRDHPGLRALATAVHGDRASSARRSYQPLSGAVPVVG